MFAALEFQPMWAVGLLGLVLVWVVLWRFADADISDGQNEDAIAQALMKKRGAVERQTESALPGPRPVSHCAFCPRLSTGVRAVTIRNDDDAPTGQRKFRELCGRCTEALGAAGDQGLVLKTTGERWHLGHQRPQS
jgi:hypothetical protein